MAELFNQTLKTTLGASDRIASGIPGQTGADNILFSDLVIDINYFTKTGSNLYFDNKVYIGNTAAVNTSNLQVTGVEGNQFTIIRDVNTNQRLNYYVGGGLIYARAQDLGSATHPIYRIDTENNAEVKTRLYISADGEIGINETSPTARLHVGETSGQSLVRVISTDATSNSTIALGTDAREAQGYLIAYGSATSTANRVSLKAYSDLTFNTGTTISERMRIDSNGKVGINTTTLDTTLNISGSGPNGLLLQQDTSSAIDSNRLYFENSGGGNGIFRSVNYLLLTTGANPGTTSGTGLLYINDNGYMSLNSTPSATSELYIEGASTSHGTIAWRNGASRKTGFLTSDTQGNAMYSESISNAGIYFNSVSNEVNLYAASATPVFSLNSKDLRIGAATHSPISGTVSTLTLGGTNVNTSGGVAFQRNGTVKSYLYFEGTDMVYQTVTGNHTFNNNIEATGDIIAYA
jgi:hypothetical protein